MQNIVGLRSVGGVTTEPTGTTTLDGRRARRERGRAAVIDAVFEVLQEGKLPPSIDEIAVRAGVSTASAFRYFDGLADMQRQAFVRFQERFGHLYDIPAAGAGSREDRVVAFVDARLRLYDAVAPMLAIARARALEHDPAAEAVASSREKLADQVRAQFAPELAASTPSAGAELVALIDSLTSPESWDIAERAHGRSRRQIRRAWLLGVNAIVDACGHRERTS